MLFALCSRCSCCLRLWFCAGGDGDGDGDSLGNLSEFEDADFEAFADSLLEEKADDTLFGYTPKAKPGETAHTTNHYQKHS